GPAFEQEAEAFINTSIDNVLARPLNQLVGQIEPDKLQLIKYQVANSVLDLARSPELATSVSSYLTDALEELRPQTVGAALSHLNPESIESSKQFLTKSLLALLARDDTARTINAIIR